ncbi:hypothetical protein DFS34DRAFT_46384 [Phlyctochytrium arcticum]|nr:hypothetical protein DFS34DRAFT_46384 [Phlyctochytrium arcticum]
MGDRNMKPGDWICGSCQTHNFASRSLCFSCQAPGRPGATSGGFGVGPATGMKPGDWLCPRPTCKFQNFSSRQECMRCGSQKPGTTAGGAGVMAGHGRPTQGVPSKVLPGDWFCNQCNINNFASRTRCMQCGGPNTGGGRTIDRPGDWSCPNDSCRYHNFSR